MTMIQPRSQKLILVAEDEQDLREALVTALETIGNFLVIAVADGEAAVERALADKPDYILLDIHLPKLNGDEVLAQIRADEWGKKVLVSILTAQSDLEAISQAIAVGGPNTSYLTKTDLSLAQVVSHVQTAFR